MNIIKTPKEMLLEMAGVPHLAQGGKLMPQKDLIKAYRADPTRKFGGKNRLETQPIYYDKTMLNDFVTALKAAEPLGGRQLTPEQVANLFLVEGRSDAGYNQYNTNNKQAASIANQLIEAGHPERAAGFAAAIHDKLQTAERLKKPFPEVWNGTGVSKFGKTGKDYNNRYQTSLYAVSLPENQGLLGAIQDIYSGAATPAQTQQQDQTPTEPLPASQTGSSLFKKGGKVKNTEDMFHELIANGKTPSKLKK